MIFSSKQEVIDNISKFEGLYDVVRVVNPVSKTVLNHEEQDFHVHCYDFWDKKAPCENYVTYRALFENNTFFKMEFKKGIIYLITSCPVKINEDTYVMEMLKDITNTGIIENEENRSSVEIEKSIENLNRKLLIDELTNVYNRRFINERLPSDIFSAAANKTKLSLILLDLDNFKTINDTYSHIAGDLLLKKVSEIMKSSIRKNIDWVARFGGDEFLISLNGANEVAAQFIAESIRGKIERSEIEYDGKRFKATASIGIYTVDDENFTMDELIRRADMNMYSAKNQGRNAVVQN